MRGTLETTSTGAEPASWAIARKSELERMQKEASRRATYDKMKAIDSKYKNLDSLSEDQKVERLSRPDVNPFLLKNPYDGLSVGFNRWKTVAGDAIMSKMSGEEMDNVAGKYYDAILLPMYHQMGIEPLDRKLWVHQAFREALNYNMKNAYNDTLLHNMKHGWDAGLPGLARMGETMYNIFSRLSHNVPVAPWYDPKATINMKNFTDPLNPNSVVNVGSRIQQEDHKFWADVLPTKGTGFEKATSLIGEAVPGILQFEAIGAIPGALAEEAADAALPLLAKAAGKGNLTAKLMRSGVGQKVYKYLTSFGVGTAYGNLTSPKEDRGNAWKDGINFMVGDMAFDVAGTGLDLAAGKYKLGDLISSAKGIDSPEFAALKRRQDEFELGMENKRKATDAELYNQRIKEHATNIAVVGMHGQERIYDNALQHLSDMEAKRKEGWTRDEIEAYEGSKMHGDGAFWSPVLSAANHLRELLGDRKVGDLFSDEKLATDVSNKVNKLIVDAASQMQTHVPEMAQEGAAEAVAAATSNGNGAPTVEYFKKQAQEELAKVGGTATPDQIERYAQKLHADAVAKARQKAAEVITSDPEGSAKRGVANSQRNNPAFQALPPSLRGSTPNYGFGKGNNFTTTWEDPFDLAAYVVTGKGRSDAHEAFVQWFKKNHPDVTPAQLEAHGQRIRSFLKNAANNFDGEGNRNLHVPRVARDPLPEIPVTPKVEPKATETKKGETGVVVRTKEDLEALKKGEEKPAPIPSLKVRTGRIQKSPKDITVRYDISPDYKVYLEGKAKGAKIPSLDSKDFSEWLSQHYNGMGESDFAQHIQDNFYPAALADAGIFFEREWKKKLGPEYPNFLAFMYNYAPRMPAEMEKELEDRLVGTQKFQDAFKEGAKTQQLLDHYSHAMYNHVDDFLSSGRWPKQANLFRSTNFDVRNSTKWQKELLLERDAQEIKNLRSAFSHDKKAAEVAVAHVQELQAKRMEKFLKSYDEAPRSRRTIRELNKLITGKITQSGKYEAWEF